LISIHGKVEISVDRDQAFEAFLRMEQWPRWWRDCRAVDPPPEWAVAAAFRMILVPHKMSLKLRPRISGFKAPEMVAFDWNRLGVVGRFVWIFSVHEDGCLVEERIEMKGAGLFLLRVLGQLEAMGHMVQRNLDGFKAYLESGAG